MASVEDQERVERMMNSPEFKKLMLDTEREIKDRIKSIYNTAKRNAYNYMKANVTRDYNSNYQLAEEIVNGMKYTPHDLADKLISCDVRKIEDWGQQIVDTDDIHEFSLDDNEREEYNNVHTDEEKQKLTKKILHSKKFEQFASDVFDEFESVIDDYFDERKNEAFKFSIWDSTDSGFSGIVDDLAKGKSINPQKYVEDYRESSDELVSEWGRDMDWHKIGDIYSGIYPHPVKRNE